MHAVILQHQDDAPAGLVLDALCAAGVEHQIVHLDRGQPLPAPGSAALVVSLGSDASADDESRAWISGELAWLRRADRAGAAILGLCFGAQALALALGGGVARAERPERGWVTVSSSAPELIAPGPWLTWHDDMIELPPGAELLAANPSGPQAFRIRRHLGVQFHPEVTPAIVADWVAGSHEAGLDGAAMLADTQREFTRARVAALRLFAEVIGRADGGHDNGAGAAPERW